MNIIERVKNILVSPKTEWNVIATETTSVSTLITTYILPLALIGAIATFIGYGLIGIDIGFLGLKIKDTGWGLKMGIISLISSVVGAVVTAFIVDALAPSFGSEKNMNRSMQLVAYGYTPALVAGIFNILPSIGWLAGLIGLYGIYLMYIGLGPIKKTPEDKKAIYLIITIVVLIAVYFVLGLILGSIMGVGSYTKSAITI